MSAQRTPAKDGGKPTLPCNFLTSPMSSSQYQDYQFEETAQVSHPQQQRAVGSLVLLTQRFVELMKQNGGQIDLKKTTELLDVQKRRIYDITNVLEGVGLIEKTRHSSTVRWRGDFGSPRERDKLRSAFIRSKHLVALEADIDLQLEYARKNLKFLKEEPTNRSFAYVTRDDLLNAYGNDSKIITIPKHDEDMEIHHKKNALHLVLENGGSIDVRVATQNGQCTISNKKIADAAALESERLGCVEQDIAKLETPSASPSSASSQHMDTEDGTSTAVDGATTIPMDTDCTSKKALTPEDEDEAARIIRNNHNKHLVISEHTYYCNPELKERNEEIENEMAARIILRNNTGNLSLRRFYPDNPNLEDPPLQFIDPPREDFSFSLAPNEGICELFDILPDT